MKKIIPHIALILTAMIITLLILNYLNPFMGFLSRDISKVVIGLWIVSLVATFVLICVKLIKRKKIDECDD